MLTDLNWIAPGKPFPPPEEKGRLKGYTRAENMFKGKYGDVFGEYFGGNANQLKMQNVNVQTIINYPQLLTKKTADFVCGEPPIIDIGDATDALRSDLDMMNFSNTLYEAFMDVSRFGDAVTKTLEDRVSMVPPKYWFPIVDPYDIKKVDYQVVGFVADRQIYIEIHQQGEYERRYYEAKAAQADKSQIEFGELVKRETIETNMDENAIQVLSNVTSSDSLYGVSDYDIIEGTLKQLLWRIFCVERILDKHAAPSIVGPSSMLQKDPVTGCTLIVPGNFFARDRQEDAMPAYLTWDGNLESVQWEIEWLTNQMYTLSEMGAAFLEGAGKGEVNSGRALRLRMTSPLIKAKRLAGINEQTIKKIIRGVALSKDRNIDIKEISMTWQDGLPNDVTEDSELYERATGGKAYMSQLTAIKRFNGLDDEAAETELAAIEGESPLTFNPMELSSGQNIRIDTRVPADTGADNTGDREGAARNDAGISRAASR